MRGGHNIKPGAELQKDGTFREDRHGNRVESISKPLQNLPDPPAYFDKKHKDFWTKTCKGIHEMGILNQVDVEDIEIYVINWFIWKDASQSLIKEGIMITVETEKGIRQIKNPAEIVMRNSERTIIAIGDKFGFNPRARMGIKTEQKKDIDPFEMFLKKNN